MIKRLLLLSLVITTMFSCAKPDGFVIKGRRSIKELKTAIKKLYDDGDSKYISAEMEYILQDKTINDENAINAKTPSDQRILPNDHAIFNFYAFNNDGILKYSQLN